MLAALVLTAAVDANLSLGKVLEGMFDRLRTDTHRQVAGASWTKERTDTNIQDSQHPRPLHTETYRIWGDGTRMLQQKTVRNGRVLRNQKIEPLGFFIGPTLMDRFQFSFGMPRIVIDNGNPYWHLVFHPRLGAPKGETLEQELIGASAGVLLVDAETYGIVRINAELAAPFRSFIVDVQWSRVTIQQMLVDSIYTTHHIEMEVCFDPILGGVRTERREYRYHEFIIPVVTP